MTIDAQYPGSVLFMLMNFYSIICNFDEVMPYLSDHPVHIMCAKCPPSAETHTGIYATLRR